MKLLNLYPENSLVEEIEILISDVSNLSFQIKSDLSMILRVQKALSKIQSFKQQVSLRSNPDQSLIVSRLDSSISRITHNNFSSENDDIIHSLERIKKAILKYNELTRKEDYKLKNDQNPIERGSTIQFIPTLANQNEEPRDFIADVQGLLKNNKIKKAIDILEKGKNQISEESFKLLIVLSARFYENRERKVKNGNSQEIRSEKSQIVESLIELTFSIEAEKKQKPSKD